MVLAMRINYCCFLVGRVARVKLERFLKLVAKPATGVKLESPERLAAVATFTARSGSIPNWPAVCLINGMSARGSSALPL
jgi:hypothetical protein